MFAILYQMTQTIPPQVLALYRSIQKSGYQVYLVGGSVRNLLLKKPVKDWDMTTSATSEQILALFPDGFYDNTFGTVGVPLAQNGQESPHIVEITTFRTEREYSDRRHPGKIEWGTTIEEDLQRRDFTVNAIALEILKGDERVVTKIIDPYNGQKDLEKKLIRAVGDPSERFKEDALRLLRAVRFATQHKFLTSRIVCFIVYMQKDLS